jgi:CBS domain-containing protein
MRVHDAMRSEFIRIEPTAPLRAAAKLMVDRGTDVLLVMKADHLLGVIGLRDLYTAPMSADDNARIVVQRTEHEMVELWDHQTVEQVMAERLVRVSADADLMHAAVLLVNGDRHYLPVLQGDVVVGVIGRAEIARRLLSQGHR